MAHIGRGVADDAGAPMTAAYGADGHAHQRAASAEGSESEIHSYWTMGGSVVDFQRTRRFALAGSSHTRRVVRLIRWDVPGKSERQNGSIDPVAPEGPEGRY